MNKPRWKSRGVWIGVITGLVGSLEVIREAVMTGDASTVGIITIVLGVLKVWERVTRTI